MWCILQLEYLKKNTENSARLKNLPRSDKVMIDFKYVISPTCFKPFVCLLVFILLEPFAHQSKSNNSSLTVLKLRNILAT